MRPEFSHAAWAERARHAAWREAWRLQGLNEPWDRRPTRSLSSRRHHSHGHHRFGGQGAGGRAAHAQQNGRWSAPTSGRQADCCSASNRRSRNLPAVTVSSGLWGTRTLSCTAFALRRGDIPTGGNLTKVSTYSNSNDTTRHKQHGVRHTEQSRQHNTGSRVTGRAQLPAFN